MKKLFSILILLSSNALLIFTYANNEVEKLAKDILKESILVKKL